MPNTIPTTTQLDLKKTEHEKKIESIHQRRYLSTIHILPDLRTKKTQDYLETFLTLIALICAILFAIYPTLSTVSDLQKQLDDANVISKQLQSKTDALHNLQAQYSALQTQPVFNQIFTAIPKTAQVQMLAADLQSIGQQNNLKQKSLSISPLVDEQLTNSTTSSTKVSVISITSSFTGSYVDMEKFIHDILSFQRIVNVQSVEILRDPSGTSLTLNIVLKSYYMP